MQKYSQIVDRVIQNKLKTPLYYYDLDDIGVRFQKLQTALTSRFKINYSMKANPHEQVLKKMKSQSLYLDVSSVGEIERGIAAGYLPQHMSFVGPGKSSDEIYFALSRQVGTIIIESFEELEMFAKVARELCIQLNFCIRVNPKKIVLANGKCVENKPSQFGIDQDQIFQVKRYLDLYPHIHLIGLHFYTQSQILEAKSIVDNFKIGATLFGEVQKSLNLPLKIINFGGGFGIPYFAEQAELDLIDLNAQLNHFFCDLNFSFLNGVDLFAESGRFLVGPAGIFITKVLYKKISQHKTYLICDGGFTQHMAATGVGQMIRRNYHIHSVASELSNELETVTIAGPSCYSIDILAHDIQLNKIQSGDYIIVENSGSYGRSYSPEAFLSRPPAEEFI